MSAIHLAAAAGISRQTIYAMEAGTFIPNTAVALRLARFLVAGCDPGISVLARHVQTAGIELVLAH